ncbi:TlpA disulfide reductase family protein [Frankia sp. AgB32]|uniref:TlpA family protein disulfide reductase n=1 Tax=Frankia sp. AgB32 TaxID=631119 RepID=UPI0020106E85|nr:TlpA disulfide reductase family protein [Frankia sp. AgB32]MCK9898023.1 TlpA family protein disulfide reductase [Frankia sp. AgB32]
MRIYLRRRTFIQSRSTSNSFAIAFRHASKRALFALVLLVGAELSGCSANGVDAATGFVQSAPGQFFAPPNMRKPAPNLSGTTFTGAKISLASMRGKVVVVNFWASWCPPCRAEAPALGQLSSKNPTVDFIGINSKDKPAPAKAFIADHPLGYPNIYDQNGILSAGWPAAVGLPLTYVIDPNGDIAARITGGVTIENLGSTLDRLRAEATPAPSTTPHVTSSKPT